MSDDLEFIEATDDPICPYCETRLTQIAYRHQRLNFGFLSGFAWVILLLCPHCRKVLGTQSRS